MTAVGRVLSILSILVAAPAWAQTADDARQAVEQAGQQFERAFNQGDAAAVADLYVEDATILPPGAERMSGREAIRQFWTDTIESGVKDLRLTTVEAQPLGEDHILEIGELSLQVPGEGGAMAPATGKYLVVWQRAADDQWRLQADIWNMSAEEGEVAEQ